MLTEALVPFGLFLTRLVFRADLKAFGADIKASLQETQPSVEFQTTYQLLDNTWRAIAGAVAWMAFIVISVIPWSILGTAFRATHPILTRALADVGSGVVAFAVAGFCVYLLRMGLAVSLAQRETRRALAGGEAAPSGLGGPAIAPPGGLVRLALVVTRPSDFDFVLQMAVSALTLISVVNYAHTQGYPL